MWAVIISGGMPARSGERSAVCRVSHSKPSSAASIGAIASGPAA